MLYFQLTFGCAITSCKSRNWKEARAAAALLLALVLPSARLSGASGPWQRLVNKGHALGARCPLPYAAALLLLATTHCTYCYALPTCTPTYVGTGTLRHKAASGAFSVLYTAQPLCPHMGLLLSPTVLVCRFGSITGAKLEANW